MVEFDEIEKQIIRNAMISKSNSEIALLIDADVHDVAAFISGITTIGVATRQMKIDKKKSLHKPKPAKTPRVKVSSEAKRRELEAKKLRKEQQDEKNKIEGERYATRKASREPKYKTKVVDYSTMKTIRIDSKTLIYIKAGEDETAARKLYYEQHIKKV